LDTLAGTVNLKKFVVDVDVNIQKMIVRLNIKVASTATLPTKKERIFPQTMKLTLQFVPSTGLYLI